MGKRKWVGETGRRRQEAQQGGSGRQAQPLLDPAGGALEHTPISGFVLEVNWLGSHTSAPVQMETFKHLTSVMGVG